MAAYILAGIDVTNPEAYPEYARQVPPLVQRYGGRFLTRGGAIEGFEGQMPSRVVIIEFPSIEQARAFYTSPEYQAVIPIRQRNARTHFLGLVEGIG